MVYVAGSLVAAEFSRGVLITIVAPRHDCERTAPSLRLAPTTEQNLSTETLISAHRIPKFSTVRNGSPY